MIRLKSFNNEQLSILKKKRLIKSFTIFYKRDNVKMFFTKLPDEFKSMLSNPLGNYQNNHVSKRVLCMVAA
jgi:hypothetical protein